jgi:hypothetical protein
MFQIDFDSYFSEPFTTSIESVIDDDEYEFPIDWSNLSEVCMCYLARNVSINQNLMT